MKRVFILSSALLLAAPLSAETVAPVAGSSVIEQFGTVAMYLVLGFSLVLLWLTLSFYNMIRRWDAEQRGIEPKPGLWKRLSGLKPLEKEKDMILDHSYDGIAELDNPAPPWFQLLFYGTIVFAVVYLVIYHTGDQDKLQIAEYKQEMKNAEAQIAEYKKKSGNNIDENSVTVSADASILTEGQTIYAKYCATCHGSNAEGNAGPNLTDEYWLHGGSINNIFSTIKYGVPGKAMTSWQKLLSPEKINAVANYVYSLKGKNTPGKEPEGKLEKLEAMK